MTRLGTHQAVLWYQRELDREDDPPESVLRELDREDLDSYLADLRRDYQDSHPTTAEAWDMA